MYCIYSNNITKLNGLFLCTLFDKSVDGCGFNYGKGLTGTRLKKRNIIIPTKKDRTPDYEYMENYMRDLENQKLNKYKSYITKRLKELENYKETISLNEKEWGEYKIEDLFFTKIGNSRYCASENFDIRGFLFEGKHLRELYGLYVSKKDLVLSMLSVNVLLVNPCPSFGYRCISHGRL